MVKSWKWDKDKFIYIPEHFYNKLKEYIKITAWVSEYLFFSQKKRKINKQWIKNFWWN